ncbi:hypothetical protein Anas_09492 [Armadillidium nasatum]|uniref:Uncharacterized protein n=1 Tax=Armadillidium nasatum TaxID=96803 RepID=A0A5N5TDQ4_9CRUS|nr:hypothetical protein Anas_09492 [Armadillidium nasatum]
MYTSTKIFRRADPSTGGRCPSCTPELASLVEYALKLMQKLHPRELRLGLSYLVVNLAKY